MLHAVGYDSLQNLVQSKNENLVPIGRNTVGCVICVVRVSHAVGCGKLDGGSGLFLVKMM